MLRGFASETRRIFAKREQDVTGPEWRYISVLARKLKCKEDFNSMMIALVSHKFTGR